MTNDTIGARVQTLIDRRVSVAELREALERPLGEDEREDVLSLARWFTRRYPTGLDRLAYVRQAYTRWHRAQVGGLEP